MGTLILLILLSLFGGPTGCGCDLKIKTDSLPDATIGVPYMSRVKASCGGDFFFIQQGNLPPGIIFTDDGRFRGTPTNLGLYRFTLGVLAGDSVSYRGYSLTVLAAPET